VFIEGDYGFNNRNIKIWCCYFQIESFLFMIMNVFFSHKVKVFVFIFLSLTAKLSEIEKLYQVSVSSS